MGEQAAGRGATGGAVADPGLFGPDSVTWRVHGDPSMALGALRALMLQALHPLAMAGVAQHSSYRSDPWGRLWRTSDYVATVTYGTREQAARAGAQVRRVHRGIAGVEPTSGRPYRADDTALLRWVHCAEVDSFLAAYRRSGGRLGRGDADRYVAEQVRSAELVGVRAAEMPSSTAELNDYFATMRAELRATPEAREALWLLLSPPMPLPARPGWLWLSAVAFGLLPRWARRCYGLPGALSALPGTDLAAGVSGRSLAVGLRLVPQRIRASPARREALARLGAA